MKKSEVREMIKEELLKEGKGKAEAAKLIERLRAKTFRALDEDQLWEFGEVMYKFFEDYKN